MSDELVKVDDKGQSMVPVYKPRLKYRQRLLIKYLVAGQTIELAAEKMNVSINRCKAWTKLPRFMEELDNQIQSKLDLDAKKRKRRNEFIASELYETLMDKFSDGSLEKMNAKNLMKFIVEFNKEIRTDTPGENSKKVHHTIQFTEELASRYKTANSANFTNREAKIIDINIPNQLPEGKENGSQNSSIQQQTEIVIDDGVPGKE